MTKCDFVDQTMVFSDVTQVSLRMTFGCLSPLFLYAIRTFVDGNTS